MRKFIFVVIFMAAGITAAATPAEATFNPLTQAYQQFAEPALTCTFQGDCAVLFPATATKTIVTHVSCEFFLASGGTVLNASLGSQGSSPRNNLPTYAFATGSGGVNFGINAEVYLVYPAGQQPRIDVFSSGAPVQFLDCTVSGYHS